MGIFIAVLGSLVIGVANVLLKKSFKTFSPSVSFFVFALISFVLWGGVGLVFGGFTPGNILYGLAAGFITAILGQCIYFHALSKGELTINAPILASYSIYTIILSVLFNHEHINFATGICVLVAIVGTVIVAFPDKINKSELKKLSPILWAIGAAIAIGASDTVSKRYINDTSVGNFFVYAAFAQVITSLVYLKMQHEKINQFKTIVANIKEDAYLFWGSVSVSVGTLFLFLAFQFTLASIASPITSTYPVVTIILAMIFLKEKISLKSWIGVGLVLLAILGVGFFAI